MESHLLRRNRTAATSASESTHFDASCAVATNSKAGGQRPEALRRGLRRLQTALLSDHRNAMPPELSPRAHKKGPAPVREEGLDFALQAGVAPRSRSDC